MLDWALLESLPEEEKSDEALVAWLWTELWPEELAGGCELPAELLVDMLEAELL